MRSGDTGMIPLVYDQPDRTGHSLGKGIELSIYVVSAVALAVAAFATLLFR